MKVWTQGRPTEETIIDTQYDYYNGGGNNGRIQKIMDNVDGAYSTTFTYDDQNRLASARAGIGTPYTYERNYTYDAWGNLKQVSGTGGENPNYTIVYATNASGAPATNRIGNAGFIYDAAGNLTQDTWNTYSYNAANLLEEVGSGGRSTYQYDGDGRRVRQMAGGYGPIFYLWSSVLNQPVLELTSSGVYRAYVFDAGGTMLGLLSCDYAFYWVHQDHLGSGRKLTDVSGHVVYRVEMDPHGQTIYETADNGQTYLNPRKYATYQRDWESNLDYARARMYHHNLGRFSQPDPAGMRAADITDPQSLNLYAYVQNDPVNQNDPEGLGAGSPNPSDPYDRWMNPWNHLSSDMQRAYDAYQWAINNFYNWGAFVWPTWWFPNSDMKRVEFMQMPQIVPERTIDGIRQSIYGNSQLMKRINDCLKQLMGQHFKQVGEQTLANAPKIDARLTSPQIQARFRMTRVPYAAGVPYLGRYGTIFIGSEYFNNPSEWESTTDSSLAGDTRMQNAYIHELGNILAYRASGGNYYLFGDRNASDTDSGYQLQLCVARSENLTLSHELQHSIR